jgi:hypothetical protein
MTHTPVIVATPPDGLAADSLEQLFRAGKVTAEEARIVAVTPMGRWIDIGAEPKTLLPRLSVVRVGPTTGGKP